MYVQMEVVTCGSVVGSASGRAAANVDCSAADGAGGECTESIIDDPKARDGPPTSAKAPRELRSDCLLRESRRANRHMRVWVCMCACVPTLCACISA